jgi:hypothetical protein
MAMTTFEQWKSINESEGDYASATTLGLGGATPAARVGTGFKNLISGNLPPLKKALSLVDVLATALVELEEKDRQVVMAQIKSKLQPTVSKFAKLFSKETNTPK